MRRKVVDSVKFCLWQDSKWIKQWEPHFSRQLDAVLRLLEQVETMTEQETERRDGEVGRRPLELDPRKKQADFDPQIRHLEINYRTERQLQPIYQASTNITNKSRPGLLAKDDRLKTQASQPLLALAEVTRRIRDELTRMLRRKDRKPDASMAHASDNDARATAIISPSINFDTIRTRENAIVETFTLAYS
ncbi:hypothetical protein MFIFM68171_08561 [Madurella fahalii]|uniref:Uncharacterized protein n=1 Tax=Madurella fahalii TaxID=1157608 RepID=A0ABQ0GKV4_9PEZI